MKVKPYLQEVTELVLQYLQKQLGEIDLANQLRQKHILHAPINIMKNNLLLKKGLVKVIKSYVQMDKSIKQYYTERKVVQKDQDIEQEELVEKKESVEKPKKSRKLSANSNEEAKKQLKRQPVSANYHENTSTWVKNKFAPPKKLEEIGNQSEKKKILQPRHPRMVAKQATSEQSSERPLHSDHSEQKNKNKKVKVISKKKKQSSEQSSEESPEPRKQQVKEKKVVKAQKKQQKEAVKNKQVKIEKEVEKKAPHMQTRIQSQNLKEQNESNGNNPRGQVYAFSRIKVDQIGPIPTMLQDNSFEAKFKYGKGGDDWGKYGHEKLKDTRGDSFKKTKDKLKNKAYQGGVIDPYVINSIPID